MYRDTAAAINTTQHLRRRQQNYSRKVLALCSGGIDSVTMAHWLASAGYTLSLLAIDYGQVHVKELDCAAACATKLSAVLGYQVDCRYLSIPLKTATAAEGKASALLFSRGESPDTELGAYEVPGRNLLMLSVAFGIAALEGFDAVAIAVHRDDYAPGRGPGQDSDLATYPYPDCRPSFLAAFLRAWRYGVGEDSADLASGSGRRQISLMAPFINLTKRDILIIGDLTLEPRLVIDYRDTWSCYRSGARHCGSCPACEGRKKAFRLAGIEDPTHYVDPFGKYVSGGVLGKPPAAGRKR